MSRGRWEDMVKGVLDTVAPVSSKKKDSTPEKKGMSIEDVPGDPGSTVGIIREEKKRKEKVLSDL